ncbi:branched-chain amino acid ABC transporter permease [Plantactinospora sp. KBS50]|uniref:branched-chain amino acid ABC transporter permease n=1 Tax=Plantactinospora sp. KBS50 TaxID=2024580 RepID=UPI0012FD6C2D|nr:branched-chain amino acid ABC transporter permease [Plantactinospora sp. KBS50]
MRSRLLRRAAGVVVAATALAVPWAADDYSISLLARTLVLGLVGMSVALLTGVAGLPTLGQTGPYAAAAYTCALLAGHGQQVGVLLVVTGAAVGALFGLLTVPLVVHARGVVVLMITLAIGELVGTAASRWRSVTGGTDGLAALAPARPVWGAALLETDRARYLYTLAVVAVVLLAVVALLRTPAGAVLRAGRDDERRLRASGHPVPVYLGAAYVLAGAVAGVAGSLLVTVQQYVSPADFDFDTSALLLLGVVIGGAASMTGALVGAALVIASRDWLAGVLPGYTPLVLGAAFVATAYLFPNGFGGPNPALRRYLAALRGRRPGPTRTTGGAAGQEAGT